MKRGPLNRLIKALLRNDRGNVLILTAMGLPVLIGGAGMSVDTAQWYLWQRELQTAVDAAALSGAYSRAQNKSWEASASSELSRNVTVASLKSKSITLTSFSTPDKPGVNNAVTVSASTQRALPFSSIFLDTPPTISATATAAAIDDGEHCMISLDEEQTAAVTIEGNALLKLGCGIASNSRATTAIKLDGTAKVEASPFTAVGGIIANDANLIGDSTIRPYSTEQQNPFEGVAFTGSPAARTYNQRDAILQPGTYRGGLDLKKSHTMAPGVYVIDGGTLKVNGQESLTGSGVTIVLKNGATVDISGVANVDLTAPTSTSNGVPSSLVGVLIFEDAATSSGGSSTIKGNADLKLGGAIYLPKQNIIIDGNTEPTTECMLLVAKTMYIGGQTEIINTCPQGYDHPGDVGAKVVRLVG